MTITPALLRLSWREWITGEIDPKTPGWMSWIWTVVLAVAIGFGFSLLGMTIYASHDVMRWFEGEVWWRALRTNFVIALTIGVLIHLIFAVAIPLVGKQRLRRYTSIQRAAFFIALPLCGVIAGWPLGMWFVGPDGAQWIHIDQPGQLVAGGVLAIGVSFILVVIFSARAHQAMAEKRATEAQLRLLQGQMEPHLLFNTLANVLTLIDHEPDKARQMLESFTEYLRVSLSTMRRERSRLADELALARAYLELFKGRMEDRLQFTIDCDASLDDLTLPPLLLQPLVENAIQHGLEPKIEGGTVRMTARRAGDKLVLTVQDDGLGQSAPPRSAKAGNGVALKNLRERLHTAHGHAATLTITDAAPGTLATLTLPVDETMPCR